MDSTLAADILQRLRTGELSKYVVAKDDFYTFREVVVAQKDFKHFRGEAERGGIVVYTYMEKARS